MNTDKFYKLVSPALKKIELNRILEKMEDSPEFDFYYDSYSYTSTKQEINRSKHREKTDHKKHALNKYFKIKKAQIDPKTDDWHWENPYYHQ